MGYRTSAEIRNPFDGFIERLRLLGATEAEAQMFKDAWAEDIDDDSEEAREGRKMLLIKSDGALREILRAGRAGELADTAWAEAEAEADAPADPVADADARRAAAADAQAAWDFEHGDDFNLDQLASWVGDDAARAGVAERAEFARAEPRKGAVEIFDRFSE